MTVYSEEEVLKSCLEYFSGDELAAKVWMNKYCLRNKSGEFVELSPIERYRAIAKDIHSVDIKLGDSSYTEEDYFNALVNQEVSPGGSGLYGIANPYSITSLSNCFVIDADGEDSYGSILKVDQEIVQIAKRRGGVGTDMSHLRPKEAYVSNSAGTSSGVVSFCARHSNSSREVAQDGRRGALMLSLSVVHPDVAEFIGMKIDTTKVTGANVSVRLTDKFMHAVEGDGYYLQHFPCDFDINKLGIDMDGLVPDKMKTLMYDDKTVYVKKVKARKIWNLLIHANWLSAEPGALFWDTIIRESLPDCYPKYKTVSTNPCGEIPLSAYDSCRLFSINLIKLVVNRFTENSFFDLEAFYRVIKLAVHMMDNIIDLEIDKIKQIISKIENDSESLDTKWTELELWKKVLINSVEGRRAGISIIGHGDMLAMLGETYGSTEGNRVLTQIHMEFAREAYKASAELAVVRGPFPAYKASLETQNPFLKRIGFVGTPRRHIALLTEPPVGTLSLVMNNQTSGIEPIFLPVYKRSRKVNPSDGAAKVDYVDEQGDSWEEFPVFHPYFKEWIGIKYPEIIPEELSDDVIAALVAESPYAGASSAEIDPISKIELIGSVQKWIDHSISNTTNLPADTTEKTVSDLYLKAWKTGCKGITIYRDGSRTGVLNSSTTNNGSKFEQHDAPKRPKDLKCDIFHATINTEKYIVLVGLYDDKPYESMAFKKKDLQIPSSIDSGIIHKQKSGVYNLHDKSGRLLVDDISSKFETPEWGFVFRLISTALRHGAAIQFVVEQLNKSEGSVVSVAKVIARQLKKYIPEPEGSNICPNCGAEMHMEGGCKQCKECGYGACG